MAVDNQFLDSILSGDLAGSLQPADSTGSRSYLKQSGLKDIVALSPEERAADRATNENPAVKNELLKEIGRAKDPAARAALEQELKRQGGDPSASLTADPVAQAIKPAATFQPPKMSAREDSTRFKDYALDNNPAFGGTAAKTDSNSFSVSKEIGAAIDSYQANLWAIPAAMGSEYALQAMLDNKAAAEKGWQDSGAPQSFDEMEFGKNFGQYFAHMALQSSPYMLEFMATGFGVGSAAKAALSNTAKGIAEKAATEATKLGATKAAAQKAGEAAAASYMGKVYTASGIAGSYPSAVGDVLSNQHEQAGKFDLPTAAALGVPYAALNAAGAEGMAVRAVARGLPKSAIAKEGVAGFAGRAALTGAEAGIMEGSTETGQEVMNQLGRMAVDPDAKIDDHRALEAYKESFIAGALLGGVPGAAAGGFRKPEDAKLQPPAPVANSPLTSAVNTAQHVEKQQQQAVVDDHREQILGMIAQRDDLTERIAGLQNMIDRADPSSEDGQRIRAMQSDMQMRRDALVAQLDAAKAFYGGDQTANVGPTNDPLILGNEQMSRIYQVTQRLLNDPASLDPESRSGLLKGFSVMRNRTLPEATRIDAAMALIATMDDMAARRAAAASGRADEREWNAFASDEAAHDGEAKLRAIDKSLANSGPKPLPENEVTTMRAQLLDRVLATNPQNPNRAFDRALRLDGFRDAGFTHLEKTKIAAFLAHRTALEQEAAGSPEQEAQQSRFHHLNYMIDSGWQMAGKNQMVSLTGEVYNLKGAGEMQYVRNKLNQKAANGNQAVGNDPQSGGAQGDLGAGGAGIDGAVSQGGGNELAGSGQGDGPEASAGAVPPIDAAGNAGEPDRALTGKSRLTPLGDPRVSGYAADLRSMAPDAGWAEVGGRLIVAPDGTKSRTRWIPRAEWFLSGMLGTPQESAAAVEKAIAGQPMKKREKLHVLGMMDFLDAQNGAPGASHAEELATLSDIAYEGETEDAQDIIDMLGDVDLESIGAWNDEVESMRALGFTEEEINEITRRKQGAFGAVGETAAGVPAGEAQAAIPEGDGNVDGQAEGQEQVAFGLTQQTEEELRAKADAEAQAAAAEAAAKKAAEDKAKADAEANDFRLSGSDRPADVAVAGGQQGLFGANGQPTKAAENQNPIKKPKTLDELVKAVDAGYRAHYDFAGTYGRTIWIEQSGPGWTLKWIDDDSPNATHTQGGAGVRTWDKLDAINAVKDQADYRFNVWKPVAESAPSPVDTSMRDTGAKAFADGLPRVAPEGIKGADKVRWLTGYDTAKNSGRERHELPLAEQLEQAERDLETIMAGAEESGYVEDARVTDRINRQEKLIKDLKAEIAASQQKTDAVPKVAEQAAPESHPENDTPADPIMRERIEAAEQTTDHDATPGQKEAGNYAKGKFAWNGLRISVETAKGEDRTDKETNGEKWRVKMPATYGYILGTVGADKDHVDVFMGDRPESKRVFVVNQTKPGSTAFDEHKVMLGYESDDAVRADYLLSFDGLFGASVLGSVAGPYTVEQFKEMLDAGRFAKAKPLDDNIAYVNPRMEEGKDELRAVSSRLVRGDPLMGPYHLVTMSDGSEIRIAKSDPASDGGLGAWHIDLDDTHNTTKVPGPSQVGHVSTVLGFNKEEALAAIPDKLRQMEKYRKQENVEEAAPEESTKPRDALNKLAKTVGVANGYSADLFDGYRSYQDFSAAANSGESIKDKPAGTWMVAGWVSHNGDTNYIGFESLGGGKWHATGSVQNSIDAALEPKNAAPGTRTNGDKERAAADRLDQVLVALDKVDQAFMRNTPEASAKNIIRDVAKELRQKRTIVSIPEMLETASQRLFKNQPALSEVVDEVVASLRAADKYAETVANHLAKQEERNKPTLDKITVTRSATLDGKAVEYDQNAAEALNEIDSNMDLAKRLLECLAS